MERIDLSTRLAIALRRHDWHLIPLCMQIGMLISLLFPLRGGLIPDFAITHNIDQNYIKVALGVMLIYGIFRLYTDRSSKGFFWGSMPLMIYVTAAWLGYSWFTRNGIPISIGGGIVWTWWKLHAHMTNGGFGHE